MEIALESLEFQLGMRLSESLVKIPTPVVIHACLTGLAHESFPHAFSKLTTSNGIKIPDRKNN